MTIGEETHNNANRTRMPIANLDLQLTEAAAQTATEADIRMGYTIFLGRDPEDDAVIAEATTSQVGDFLRGLMISGEFQDTVLNKLPEDTPLSREAISPGPTKHQLDWLFNLITPTPHSERLLRKPTAWAEWFKILIAMPGFPIPPAREPPPEPIATPAPTRKPRKTRPKP